MNLKVAAGIVIIIAAFVYLIVGGLQKTAVYYMTVSELKAEENKYIDQGVRINGHVAPESIDWNDTEIRVSFHLTEGTDTLKVIYNNILPDQLADAQQVVTEGILDSSGVLQASKIFLKCPSKYEAKKSQES
jgi:cytochrome c-type biogenesis protein CcmE